MTNSNIIENQILIDGANSISKKKVYFIRHGQSTFNIAYLANNKVDPYLFDARLTEEGEKQANELSENVEKYLQDVELIISSPLTRALCTTRRGFGKFLKENSNIKCLVSPLHSETVITSDDNGRPRSIIEKENPDFNFGDLQERWWYLPSSIKDDLSIDTELYFKTNGYKEPIESILHRIEEFKKFLLSRNESTIAVVGHSDFFYHFFDRSIPHMKNCQIVSWCSETNEKVYITK
ncbi:phosphoglycerate/bisphosphoglycerate mutase family protein [Dictyostelium discoideum AX4]|uniref:Phosphoglycerate/bisphosphoglycerate mutase family protein n=1 Tax=Dictyostelium discoideum TaxID=44689 RepID=Q54GY0_DICDI|nr:phosphoglycerate/bisphosphoglycerate mutase family protein [Dictyostelium discoideum AX4]EAL62518.1 phosphoglycerate/bisphosphoglycerate mutase family protein [Dictyostelium discoideum AX4]|eukprot:XP_636027.1 phosphoglycerate/bisphosphoglycerate mutase family protein [Dictyostelium discoideum AX4]